LDVLKSLPRDGDYLFHWRGERIDDCNTLAFKTAVTAAKLDPLRWHDLRHTWASWAVQSGVTLHELMLLGGWRSFSMVLRYAHFAPDHLAAAAAKIRLNFRTKTGTVKRPAKKSAHNSFILVVREGLEPGASPKRISKLFKSKGAASPWIP
jgi:hypothetical protein